MLLEGGNMGAGTEWLAVQRGQDGGGVGMVGGRGWRAVAEAAAHPEAGSRRFSE